MKSQEGNISRGRSSHGESLVLPIGVVLTVAMVALAGGSAWWAHRAQSIAMHAVRIEQVRAAGVVMASAAEALISVGQLSTIRRLLTEAAREHDLSLCSVLLPEGGILADADPTRIDVVTLPADWLKQPFNQNTRTTESDEDGLLKLRYPLWVDSQPVAALHIEASLARPNAEPWYIQAGPGALGAAGLLGLLLVYRWLRFRVAALGLISESLRALDKGEPCNAVLDVDEQFGAEAVALNKLLESNEQMQQQLIGRRAAESLATDGAGADLGGVCDGLRQGLLLIDEQMRVAYANGAACVYLQHKRDQMLRQEVWPFITDTRVAEAIRTASSGPSRRRSTVEVSGQETSGMLRFNIRPLRRGDSTDVLIVIEDVTQQRVAEESRNAFVAHATHELRMPLTNIRLYLETALDEGEHDAQVRGKCLNVISQETNRLERLVGDMLSISEIEAGSLKIEKDDVRLDALFADLEGNYQGQAREKQISLKFDLPPKLPVIQADRDKLMMAMQNMVGNAIKYTPSDGSVLVNVDVEMNELAVEVRDTGIGISAEDAAHIFDQFYRAKDNRLAGSTGSGLGLTLAREVVRLQGGDITVESELNQGSVFTLKLPIVAESMRLIHEHS